MILNSDQIFLGFTTKKKKEKKKLKQKVAKCFLLQAMRLPTVTSIRIPEGFPDWKAVPTYLMKK